VNTAQNDGGAVWITADTGVGVTFTDVNFESNRATRGAGGAVLVNSSDSNPTFDEVIFFSNKALIGGGAVRAVVTKLTFNGGSFDSNQVTRGDGGAINVKGTLSVANAPFLSSSASDDGGAVFIDAAGASTFTDSDFDYNTGGSGGAIYTESSGAVTITRGHFVTNVATAGDGGAIFANGPITINAASLGQNTANNGNGGAISSTSTVSVSNAPFTSNTAGLNGGAIYGSGATATVDAITCDFTTNKAQSGGAVYIFGDSASFDTLSFTSNQASSGDGGAVRASATLDVSTVFFDRNTASASGGAISVTGDADIHDSNFTTNSGYNGGAIECDGGGKITAADSIFSHNRADQSGGAVNSACAVAFSKSTFASNTAVADGGALYCNAVPSGTDDTSSYQSNSAGGNGGAVAGKCSVNFAAAAFNSNTAQNHGGAVYLATGASSTFAAGSFLLNTAGKAGGALASSGTAAVTGPASIDSNTAKTFGGGVMALSGGAVTITNVIFTGNSAPLGNSVASESSSAASTLTVKDTTFPADPAAYAEGGMIAELDGTASFEGGSWGTPTGLAKGYAFRTNSSTVTFSQDISFPKVSVNGGTLTIAAGAVFNVTSLLPLLSGGIGGAGTLWIANRSILDWQEGTIAVANVFVDFRGKVLARRGDYARSISSPNFVNKGLFQLDIAPPGPVDDGITDCASFAGGALINNGTFVLGEDCEIKGTGSIVNNGEIFFAKSNTFAVDYTAGHSSLNHFSVYDDSTSDQLIATGTVTLGGTLSADTVGGYVPDTEAAKKNKSPASWTLIAAQATGSIKGNFDTAYIRIGDRSVNATSIINADANVGELKGGSFSNDGKSAVLTASAYSLAAPIASVLIAVVCAILLL